jgi:hypothetical protein
MSLTVQGAASALWPQRAASATRPASERLDSDIHRDAWSPADPKVAPNRYDQAIDSLRTAALRRDAALAATAKAEKAATAADDTALHRDRESPA